MCDSQWHSQCRGGHAAAYDCFTQNAGLRSDLVIPRSMFCGDGQCLHKAAMQAVGFPRKSKQHAFQVST